MEILYWSVIVILCVAVLFGIKEWIRFILGNFAENGVKATILLIIFSCLLVAPSFIKSYAPDYYGYAIWALILYTVAVLAVRYNKRGNYEEG
jgi:hypothetical protein